MAAPAAEEIVNLPSLSAERPVVWPERTRITLPNGLQIVLATSEAIPKFHGELYFRAGNASVADRSACLAEMTATLVRTGTTNRTSRQIEEDLRRLGADLGTSAGQDTSAISFAGLSEFSEPLLQLVNELATQASFPAPELERERRQKLEEVRLERTSPGFLAGERLRKALFGSHPYAMIAPTEEQVAAYNRAELEAVYRQIYTPENALLILVGISMRSVCSRPSKRFSASGPGRSLPRSSLPCHRIRVVAACCWYTIRGQCRRKLCSAVLRLPAKTLIGCVWV